MTIDTQTMRVIYTGNGTSRRFAVNFPYIEAANILAFKSGESLGGAVVQLKIGIEYTVEGVADPSGIGFSGGTVVLAAALESGYRLAVVRMVEMTQELDYPEGGRFPARSHEFGLDKLTMIVQQIQEEVDRAIKISITDENDPPTAEELYAEMNGIADRAEDAVTRAEAAADTAEEARDEAVEAANSLKDTGVALTTLSTAAYDVEHEDWPSAQYYPETNMIWFGVPRGRQGDIGPVGPMGPEGPQGVEGPQGPQGEKGDDGDDGPMGPVAPGVVVGLIDGGGAAQTIDDIFDCGRAGSF